MIKTIRVFVLFCLFSCQVEKWGLFFLLNLQDSREDSTRNRACTVQTSHEKLRCCFLSGRKLTSVEDTLDPCLER